VNTVRKLCESDETGTVRLDLHIGSPRRRVEVVIVWQEVEGARAPREAKERKRALLEALAGALADDPIVRPEQPPLDETLPVE
jgi:hypothetical protein